MYLFDTDTISGILKKDPPVALVKRLARVPSEHQFTSTINIGELVYGAYKSDRPAYFLKKLNKELLPNVNTLPFDEEAAFVYGKLRADMERKGTPISEPDLRIAAIALSNRFVVVTGNVRHFSKIPRLRIENWLHR